MFPSTVEQTLLDTKMGIAALSSAPDRFDIESNLFFSNKSVKFPTKLQWIFNLLSDLNGIRKDTSTSFTSLSDNPLNPKDSFTPQFHRDFESYAKFLGINGLGYAKLPEEAIFKGKAVLFDQVIVLTMEMDKDKIAMAPSRPTFKMIMRTYYELGNKINVLVGYLRKNGYAAQGGHPLNGLSLYPLIAERAGLAWQAWLVDYSSIWLQTKDGRHLYKRKQLTCGRKWSACLDRGILQEMR